MFVCGPYPHWLMMTGKGALRVHPMGIDGFVTCFAPFHNINCPKGFLYFNRRVRFVAFLPVLTINVEHICGIFRARCAFACFPHTCRTTRRGRFERCLFAALRTASRTTSTARFDTQRKPFMKTYISSLASCFADVQCCHKLLGGEPPSGGVDR